MPWYTYIPVSIYSSSVNGQRSGMADTWVVLVAYRRRGRDTIYLSNFVGKRSLFGTHGKRTCKRLGLCFVLNGNSMLGTRFICSIVCRSTCPEDLPAGVPGKAAEMFFYFLCLPCNRVCVRSWLKVVVNARDEKKAHHQEVVDTSFFVASSLVHSTMIGVFWELSLSTLHTVKRTHLVSPAGCNVDRLRAGGGRGGYQKAIKLGRLRLKQHNNVASEYVTFEDNALLIL